MHGKPNMYIAFAVPKQPAQHTADSGHAQQQQTQQQHSVMPVPLLSPFDNPHYTSAQQPQPPTSHSHQYAMPQIQANQHTNGPQLN